MLGALPGRSFSYVLDVQSGNDGLFALSVAGAEDVAGNPNVTPAGATFFIATAAPAAVLTYSADPAAVSAPLLVTPATVAAP